MKRIFGIIFLALAVVGSVGYIKNISKQKETKQSGNAAYDAGQKAGRRSVPVVLATLAVLGLRWLFSGDDSMRPAPPVRRSPIGGARPGSLPPPLDPSLRGGQDTYASNPARIRLKAIPWLAANPWVLVVAGIFALAGFVVLFIKLAVGLVLMLTAGVVVFQQLREAKQKFWGGVVNAGVVISAAQNLVAVCTDLQARSNVPHPAIKLLKQPLNRLATEPAYDGMRVATTALYAGSIGHAAWKDFSPEVIACVVRDPEVNARVFASIPEDEWQTLDALMARLPVTRPGLYRMWGDHLEKDATPWLKRKPVLITLSLLVALAGFLGLINLIGWQAAKARERREDLAATSPTEAPTFPRPTSSNPRRTRPTSTPEPPSTPPGNPVGAAAARVPTSLELGGRVVTVTNINGRVYENIKLQRADRSGLIYTAEGGGGRIKLGELPPAFLQELGVPNEWSEGGTVAGVNPSTTVRGLAAGAPVWANWGGKWVSGTITEVRPGGFVVMVQLQDPRYRFPIGLSTNQIRFQ